MPVYKIYGFDVAIDLDLNHVPISSEKPSILIKESEVPDHLDQLVYKSTFFESTAHEILIRYRQQALFWVSEKNIKYSITENIDKLEFTQFLIGPVFSALLHLRGEIPLHASAIIVNQNAVLFAGDSGSGKSTLAASYVRKGFQMLADDISLALNESNQRTSILPSMPFLKLWNDSAKQLTMNIQNMIEIASKCEKKAWEISSMYCNEKTDLSKIFIIKKSPIDHIKINAIKGFEKIKFLNEIIYRSYFTRGLNNQASIFEKLTIIAKNAEIFLVNRPTNTFPVGIFQKKVNEFL